jgi:AraC-like DNA-binding protein
VVGPLGAYTLLGLPMDELSGHTVDLADVLGSPTWAQRFALLDGFLLRRLADGPRPAPEIDWAWQRPVATGGAAPIGQLAAEVGWSHRHLIARFRQQVGLAPKTAARRVRFDRVWRRLDQPQPLDWADLAREAGYADQAHLVREFHRFTGTTRPPSRVAARSIPFKTRPWLLPSLVGGRSVRTGQAKEEP